MHGLGLACITSPSPEFTFMSFFGTSIKNTLKFLWALVNEKSLCQVSVRTGWQNESGKKLFAGSLTYFEAFKATDSWSLSLHIYNFAFSLVRHNKMNATELGYGASSYSIPVLFVFVFLSLSNIFADWSALDWVKMFSFRFSVFVLPSPILFHLAKYQNFFQNLWFVNVIIIGPESDHWQCLSLTHWLITAV